MKERGEQKGQPGEKNFVPASQGGNSPGGKESPEQIQAKWFTLSPLARQKSRQTPDDISQSDDPIEARIKRADAYPDKPRKGRRRKQQSGSVEHLGGYGGHTKFPPGYIKEHKRIRQLLQESEDQADNPSGADQS